MACLSTAQCAIWTGLTRSGLPVQASGVAPMAAHETLIPFDCDRPVRFAGVTVLPDDWVLADRDGILVLTLALVDLLLEHQEIATAKDAFLSGPASSRLELTKSFPFPRH